MTLNSPSDLSKLTVPQLKALCKERRIIGYSKLSKAVLLQKLAEFPAPTPPPTHAAPVAPATPAEVRNPPGTESRVENVPQRTHQPIITNTKSNETSSTRVPPELPSQNRPSTSTASTRNASGTKRPAHTDISAPPKRTKTAVHSTTTVSRAPEPLVPRTSTLQQKAPAEPQVFKVPELPASRGLSFHDNSTLAKQPSAAGTPVSRQIAGGPGRFKALVMISKPKPHEANKNEEPSRALAVESTIVASALGSSFRATDLPVLSNISLPPKASERKLVYRWAIILSAISSRDEQACMLVSRTFRYAVYLSAAHILSRDYAGRRLDAILEQHPRNMTNFWPYLRFRMAEISERRRAFERSFLGRYTQSIGYHPLSRRLWTSPDDEKQVDVAIRFVLTRMWFAISVGAYGHDASTWSRCVVQDAREVVKGEVWQVTARDDRAGQSNSFYVLETTCEVIGQPPSSQREDTLGYHLRADWSAWISERSRTLPNIRPRSLLECVKWSNTEDYYQGISKAWLSRVQGEDADNVAKKIVAGRYILACVMANGISGRWMSTSAMAQEFAGLHGKIALDSRAAGRAANTVNMYLPAHHHIESVHFTTSKGYALYGAIAVIQTPGREYYVLRDNGMQVGCEEEGIPEVWQRILGCDSLGRAH